MCRRDHLGGVQPHHRTDRAGGWRHPGSVPAIAMTPRVFAAIDLGASSGRVVTGIVDDSKITLEVAHRFANDLRQSDGHLRWDLRRMFDEAVAGLGKLAAAYPQVESIGID